MKSLLVLGALLLSATPAFADDFVYLECRGKVVSLLKGLISNRMKREEVYLIKHFEIDLAYSRMMTASNPEWQDVEIVNGEVVIDEELTLDRYTLTMKSSMQIVPASRWAAESFARNETTSQSETGTGTCKAIDASVFEKVLEARS